MSFPQRNENNLVQGSASSRQSLDKMRSKLVTAKARGAKGPALSIPKAMDEPVLARRTPRNLVAFVSMLMATAVIYAYLEKDRLRETLFPAPIAKAYPAEPGKNWSADEKAVWWAYAAFDRAKFDARFGALPDGAVLNSSIAAAKLDKLLRGGTVKNPIVLSEISRMRNAAGKERVPAPSRVGKGLEKP
ncbi:MAG TPA: hypothetical protein VK465_13530 [Fibrobacteria bacterium]|nr:hypothetical protein [Fibrobacteria bacterium]